MSVGSNPKAPSKRTPCTKFDDGQQEFTCQAGQLGLQTFQELVNDTWWLGDIIQHDSEAELACKRQQVMGQGPPMTPHRLALHAKSLPLNKRAQ